MAAQVNGLKNTTADGRNLSMMEHGYSMMTVIDYPIDQFGDMIESITKEYGGKIELSPFDEDMGDKHGNYYSRDDEDFGITALDYKLKGITALYEIGRLCKNAIRAHTVARQCGIRNWYTTG